MSLILYVHIYTIIHTIHLIHIGYNMIYAKTDNNFMSYYGGNKTKINQSNLLIVTQKIFSGYKLQ